MDAIEVWQDYLRMHGRKDTTVTNYGRILRAIEKILRADGLSMDPQQAGPREYLAIRSAPGMKDTSRRTYCTVYRRFVKYYTGIDLEEECDVLWAPFRPTSTRWITDAQFRILWEHADARERVVLALGAWMGLRRAEIAAVRWCDTTDGRLLVHGKGHGRDGKLVSMLMPPAVVKALETWRKACPRASLYVVASEQPKGSDYSMEPASVGAMVKRLGRRCGVDLTTHSLRRLYACDLDAREVSPVQIAQLMRHESINTTYRCYLRADPSKLDEIVMGIGADY